MDIKSGLIVGTQRICLANDHKDHIGYYMLEMYKCILQTYHLHMENRTKVEYKE